jgi:hypothetical protein
MKSDHRGIQAIMRTASGRRFWRWPRAFGLALALALVISLFHDLPALAGTAGSDPLPAVAMSSTTTPALPSDSQAPALGCHCLCHLTSQAFAAPVVTPVIFNDRLRPLRDSTAPPSCAGLPPFRPPRA